MRGAQGNGLAQSGQRPGPLGRGVIIENVPSPAEKQSHLLRFGLPAAVLGLTGAGSQCGHHANTHHSHHQNNDRGAKEKSFSTLPGPQLSNRSASAQEQKLIPQFGGIAMASRRFAGPEAKNDLLKLPLDAVSGLDPLVRGQRVVCQTLPGGDLIQDHSEAVEISRRESGTLRSDVSGGTHTTGSLSGLAHQPHISQTGTAAQKYDV